MRKKVIVVLIALLLVRGACVGINHVNEAAEERERQEQQRREYMQRNIVATPVNLDLHCPKYPGSYKCEDWTPTP